MFLLNCARTETEAAGRICPLGSKRNIFAIIIGACSLCVLTMIYYTDIWNLTAASIFHRFLALKDLGNMKYFKSKWTSRENNITIEGSFEQNHTASPPGSFQEIFTNRSLSLIPEVSVTTNSDSKKTLSPVSKTTIRPDSKKTLSPDSKKTLRPVSKTAPKYQEQGETRPNKSTETLAEVYSNTTTVTFNSTLVVNCKDSPFIECGPSKVKVTTEKIFRITFLRRPWWLSLKINNVKSCQYSQCLFHDNNITNMTDLVVVYGVRLHDSFKLPKRWNNQSYAIAFWESPVYAGSDFLRNASSVWNHQFNLIMSYRVDSDMFIPYSKLRFVPKPLDKRPNYYEIAKNKTRTAVWLVSHCQTQSNREGYVREMQKYIDVDIFGGCGQPCPKGTSTCENLANYKFYLSFENSLCTDYITEKFFKLFVPGMHVIPVVRGGTDYDKYFSNNTYINAAHFDTAIDLALHLKKLALDLETYSQYLEYKDMYVENIALSNMACIMCEFLHTHEINKTKKYNLTAWIGDGHCHKANDL